jgi:(2Fe-2S) ferredoxin
MEDLARARENALERQDDLAKTKPYHIRVSLASCGIAAGAADTLDALDHLVTSGNISGVSPDVIRISKIGCLGLCALEPIVQVEIANQPLVTYGKVTPTVAERILRDHIGKGIVVQDYVVEIF